MENTDLLNNFDQRGKLLGYVWYDDGDYHCESVITGMSWSCKLLKEAIQRIHDANE